MRLYVLSFVVMIVVGWSANVAQDQKMIFLFTIDDESNDFSSLCWIALDAYNTENCISVPKVGTYAVSPDGLFLAIREQMNGEIHIVDLTTDQVTSLGLCQPLQQFLWDEHYQTSGTLLWSPDAQFLAFTGIESQSTCNVADRGNLYLYAPRTNQLVNLTSDVSVLRSLIVPASWSPDGEWLALYGAWSEGENAQGDIIPDWGSAIISRDGATFFEFAPSYNTCRLSWSPNMKWLASNTICFDSIGTGSSIIVIPFDLATQNQRRLDEIISPIRFDWRPDSTWTSMYGTPIWTETNTLVTHRRISPISFGYLSDAQTQRYSSSGLVEIDPTTFAETPLPYQGFQGPTYLVDGWFVAQSSEDGTLTAFNPETERQVTSSSEIQTCPISYALRIETEGNFVAVLNACDLHSAEYSIDIYNTEHFDLALRLPIHNSATHLIGFYRRSS